jgi:putative endonuclease
MAFKRSSVRSRSAPLNNPIYNFSYALFCLYPQSELTGISYVGHTSNLEKRLVEQNNGKSLSTRSKKPWKLVYKEEYPTRSEAISRERYLKSVNGRLEFKAKGIL